MKAPRVVIWGIGVALVGFVYALIWDLIVSGRFESDDDSILGVKATDEELKCKRTCFLCGKKKNARNNGYCTCDQFFFDKLTVSTACKAYVRANDGIGNIQDADQFIDQHYGRQRYDDQFGPIRDPSTGQIITGPDADVSSTTNALNDQANTGLIVILLSASMFFAVLIFGKKKKS